MTGAARIDRFPFHRVHSKGKILRISALTDALRLLADYSSHDLPILSPENTFLQSNSLFVKYYSNE